MSIPEETGKAVAGVVDALKLQPTFLVLIILNMKVLGMIYFGAQAQQTRDLQRFSALLERCNFQQYGGPENKR